MKKIALFLIGIFFIGITVWIFTQRTNNKAQGNADLIEVVMYKNPSCTCCDRWAKHLEKNGFNVTIKVEDDMPAIKESHNIPMSLSSCHTAIVEGYVVEGHVPASDIKKMLQERPNGIGLTAPGMPASSPGMDIPSDDTYNVYFLNIEGETSLFATH